MLFKGLVEEDTIRSRSYFIINNFNSKNENAKKLIIHDNWFFSYGDYDVF